MPRALFSGPLLLLVLVVPTWGLLAGAAVAAPLPRCAGSVEIAHAKVIRVERNGVLVLSDGRAAVLEGVRLVHATSGLLESTIAPKALAAVRVMTTDTPVTFTAVRPKEDRYDRLRAQAFAGGVWLQVALLEKGLARVDLAADRGECADQLYAAEARARAAHAGTWQGVAKDTPPRGDTPPHFQVLGPQQMRGKEGTFQVMEGWVTGVGHSGSRAFIDFGNDWRRGFSATIAPEDKNKFKGFNLDALVARHVRIRGMVQNYRGKPEIVLSDPAQIEILDVSTSQTSSR